MKEGCYLRGKENQSLFLDLFKISEPNVLGENLSKNDVDVCIKNHLIKEWSNEDLDLNRIEMVFSERPVYANLRKQMDIRRLVGQLANFSVSEIDKETQKTLTFSNWGEVQERSVFTVSADYLVFGGRVEGRVSNMFWVTLLDSNGKYSKRDVKVTFLSYLAMTDELLETKKKIESRFRRKSRF